MRLELFPDVVVSVSNSIGIFVLFFLRNLDHVRLVPWEGVRGAGVGQNLCYGLRGSIPYNFYMKTTQIKGCYHAYLPQYKESLIPARALIILHLCSELHCYKGGGGQIDVGRQEAQTTGDPRPKPGGLAEAATGVCWGVRDRLFLKELPDVLRCLAGVQVLQQVAAVAAEPEKRNVSKPILETKGFPLIT